MSKNKRNFVEQKLFESFSSAEMDTPASMWENIESALDNREGDKKRPFLFIYFFLFIILSGFSSYFIFNHNKLFANKSGIQYNTNDDKNSDNYSQYAPELNVHRNVSSRSEEFSNMENNTGGTNVVQYKAGRKIELSNSLIKSPVPALVQGTIKENKNIAAHQNLSLISSTENSYFDERKSEFTQNSAITKGEISNQHKLTIAAEKINVPSGINTGNRTDSPGGDLSNAKYLSHLSFNKFNKIDSRSYPLLSLKSLILTNNLEINAQSVIRKEKRIKYFYAVAYGAGIPVRDLSYKATETGLFRERSATETPYYTTNVALSLGVIADKQWSVSTGLELQTVIEKFYYEKDNATVIIQKYDVTNKVYYDSLATGLMIEGGKNKYTLLNFPIDLGYEKRLGKWKIGLEAGLGLNLFMNAHGKIVKADQDVRKLEDFDNIYKANVGLQLRLACSFNRNLNNKTVVYVKPQFVKYTEDWTLEMHASKISYEMVNLNVGIKRLF